MEFLLVVILAVFVFEYINGFHDAANAIATVVSTRVLTAQSAVIFAAAFNLLGALSGEAVANTVGVGLIDISAVTLVTLLAATLAGIGWNLLTWWWRLPTSSSHALIGGLCGAALASAGNNWGVLRWNIRESDLSTGATTSDGLWPKVIVPAITSPLAGLVGAFLIMSVLLLLVRHWRPSRVDRVFGRLQLASSAFVAWVHGFADAQKAMGIIALATFTATKAGQLENLPPEFRFLYSPTFEIHTWIKVTCALVMAGGTWAGGWRIVRTLGFRLVPLRTIHGFAAESTAATVLLIAGRWGMPVSTTYAITTSIIGVGVAQRPGSLNRFLTRRIVLAWVATLPVTALVGYGAYHALASLGLR